MKPAAQLTRPLQCLHPPTIHEGHEIISDWWKDWTPNKTLDDPANRISTTPLPLIAATLPAASAEEVHYTSRTAAGAFVSLVVRVTELALVRPDVVRQLRLEIMFAYR